MAFKNIKRGGVEYTVPMPGDIIEDRYYCGEKYLVVEHRFGQNPDNYTSEPAKGQHPDKLIARKIVDDLYLDATVVEIPGDAVAVRPPWQSASKHAVQIEHSIVQYYTAPGYRWCGPFDNGLSDDNMLVQAILELRQSSKELREQLDTLQSAFDQLKDAYDNHRQQSAAAGHNCEGF